MTERQEMVEEDVPPALKLYRELIAAIKKFLRRARQCWITRHTILRGERVWDYTQKDRTSQGYLGPWQFHAFKTSIVIGAGALAHKLFGYIHYLDWDNLDLL